MEGHTILERDPRAVSAEVGDEFVFLDEQEGVYYSLSEVGAFVWRVLATPRSFDEVIQAVLEEYEVGEQQLRQDLSDLVEDLRARNLLRPDAPEGAAE